MRTWLVVTAMVLGIGLIQKTSFAQEMVLPANPSKPKLVDRCQSRMMTINNHEAFMDELVKWMGTCVTSQTINPETGQPYRREYELVNKAFPDIKAIYEYAKQPSPFPNQQFKVNAEYIWGRLLSGSWYVRAVHFWIIGHELPLPPPDPPDPEYVWKPVFQPETTSLYFLDISVGKNIVETVKQAAYREAKKEAALLKNPIDPPTFQNMAKTFWSVAQGGEIPHMYMAKMVIGTLAQAAINNQAGDVAKIRRAAYFYFVLGFVQVIAPLEPVDLQSPFESKYYALGQQEAGKLTEKEQYQVQMALLYYISKNPSAAWRIPPPQNWTFPEDYARNWSPERLFDGLYNQLYRTKYSVD